MKLRPYQQEAFDAAMSWIRTCLDPCIIGAATGSGKSHIIAAIAHEIHKISGKKILCIAPSGELVEQNHSKYIATGNPASIYSATLGRKDMHNAVVFGTPQTVVNSLRKFGASFAAVVVDEAHGITPTLLKIINHIKSQNDKLRIIGLSATPYRLGTGYIYANHYQHGIMEDAIEPFFHTMVYDIGARYLIDMGYLTPPVFEATPEHYDTSGLVKSRTGQWTKGSIDEAFTGKGRKTSLIVSDIVEKSRNRCGVIIFASSVQHAKEVMESLPPALSAMVTGNTAKDERRHIIKAFKEKRIKYLVNVSVLTTGFDAPHIDVIAILRATESVALLQQIIGRGLRIEDGKDDCLILDYAENIERHCQGGDVFDPTITARVSIPGDPMRVICPICHFENLFGARKNEEGYGIEKEGYFIDLAGNRITGDYEKPIPSHYGRRCQGKTIVGGHHVQCHHKWSFKECPECEAENDIAARYCSSCRAEIVDPNEKLKEIAAKMASDPYRLRVSEVLGWQVRRWPGRDNKPDTLRVDFHVDGTPNTISKWFTPRIAGDWKKLTKGKASSIDEAVSGVLDMPSSVAYRKKAGSRFFDVLGFE